MPLLETIALTLSKRKLKLKLNGTYSLWSELIFRVPEGFILEPLLLNIFLCNLFQFFPDIDFANYADGNTPHSTSRNLSKVFHN